MESKLRAYLKISPSIRAGHDRREMYSRRTGDRVGREERQQRGEDSPACGQVLGEDAVGEFTRTQTGKCHVNSHYISLLQTTITIYNTLQVSGYWNG